MHAFIVLTRRNLLFNMFGFGKSPTSSVDWRVHANQQVAQSESLLPGLKWRARPCSVKNSNIYTGTELLIMGTVFV